ncbi:MAG: MFS transporter [bacterium]|nr:MFS transporter [Deltaproteobacteria bacterium]MCP4907901.1 MFS transporter [bacterium]
MTEGRSNPNYVLGICFALTALNVMDRQVLAITAGAIQSEFGLSDTELGVLTGFAFVVMHVGVGIPISAIADRANRRNLISLGLVAWSALTAATGLAQNYLQIFAARIGVGIGEAVGSGPLQSLLSDYFPVARRATALAITAAGGQTGAFLALLAGGLLVDSLGWRATFLIFGLPGLVLAIVLWRSVAEPERGAADQIVVEVLPLREGFSRFLGLPAFWYLTASATFNQFTNYGFLFFLPLALMRLHGLEASEAGVTLAFAQAAPTFAGVLCSGLLADRLGRIDLAWHLRVPAIASILAVPLAIAFLSINSLWLALPLCAAMSFLGTMWLGTGNAALQSVVHPSVRATAYSVLQFFASLIGLGCGPAFVGWASESLSGTYGEESIRFALMMAACVQLLGGLAHYLASRRYARDMLGAQPSQ